jgi:hypothetical protein
MRADCDVLRSLTRLGHAVARLERPLSLPLSLSLSLCLSSLTHSLPLSLSLCVCACLWVCMQEGRSQLFRMCMSSTVYGCYTLNPFPHVHV